MPITAQNLTLINVTPNVAYFSLVAERMSGTWRRAELTLQRGFRTAAGLWFNDPRPGAVVKVELPASCNDEALALVEQLRLVLNRKYQGKVAFEQVTDVRFRFDAFLRSDNQHLDYRLVVQLRFGTGGQWIADTVASLQDFVDTHSDLSAGLLGAIAAMDTAISTVNATEKWV